MLDARLSKEDSVAEQCRGVHLAEESSSLLVWHGRPALVPTEFLIVAVGLKLGQIVKREPPEHPMSADHISQPKLLRPYRPATREARTPPFNPSACMVVDESEG